MLHPAISSDDHVQGDPKAQIVLVEYGDYECPHCAHAHPVVQKLQKKFGDRLAFVFRNFPLNEIHPNAEAAAEAAEFAATRGKFWEMHDAIYENQDQLSPEYLAVLADQVGLSADDLAKALDAGEFEPRVKSDFLSGVRSGVNGTPTFFINGERFDSPPMYDDLVAALKAV